MDILREGNCFWQLVNLVVMTIETIGGKQTNKDQRKVGDRGREAGRG